jgi:hypothetical protein
MNSNQKKILKYKTKYLMIKNKMNQIGGRIVTTLDNNGGQLDGMTNQCLWISILQYLQRNGYPRLTLRQLREQGGLDSRTEHVMFNIDPLDPGNPFHKQFLQAGRLISNLYNLDIQILNGYWKDQQVHTQTFMDSSGFVRENIYRPFETNESERRGRRPVQIINYRQIHFELIVENGGSNFQPAISFRGKLTKVSDLPPDVQEKIFNTKKEQNEEIDKQYALLFDLERTYTDEINSIALNGDFEAQDKDFLKKEALERYKLKKSQITDIISALNKSLLDQGDKSLLDQGDETKPKPSGWGSSIASGVASAASGIASAASSVAGLVFKRKPDTEPSSTPSQSRSTASQSRPTPSQSRSTASQPVTTASQSRSTASQPSSTASQSRSTTSSPLTKEEQERSNSYLQDALARIEAAKKSKK